MIKTETLLINGIELIHTFSDTYTLIQNETNLEYIEAYDLKATNYTYKESNNLLVKEKEENGN